MKKIYYLLFATLLLVACDKPDGSKDPDSPDRPQTVIPDFSWTGSPIAPAELDFNNLTQHATAYQWDFGNGTRSSSQHPGKIIFQKPGAYTVTLRASNSSSNVFTSRVVLVTEDDQPKASFSYAFKDNISYAPATVKFVNESVNAKSYEWDINGRKDNVQSPIDYIFSAPGTYKATLIAINGQKRSAVFEQQIVVESNPNPVAKFAVGHQPAGYFVGYDIYLVNQSTNCDSYLWNFGADGPADDTAEHAVVRFTKAGVHKITLTAKKGGQSSKPYVISLLVKEL